MRTRSLGSRYWQARLARWPKLPSGLLPGYTLLLPVPGDLPVFLELALAVSAAQTSEHRLATVVIPDRMTTAISEITDSFRADWPDSLTVQRLPIPERWFLPLLKSGSRNHGMQVITGTATTRTSHVVLHDADLFPCQNDLIESQYLACRDRDLDCLGLSGVWDPWYEQRGLRLAATWDLVARVDWLRSFPPRAHIGHDGEFRNERHTFDTTLLPQALTAPERIDYSADSSDFVHFNYVISAYRFFQQHGAGYLDDRFLMFFISLMRELVGPREHTGGSDLPNPYSMLNALHSSSPVLRFPDQLAGRKTYAPFRRKLATLLDCFWITEDAKHRILPVIHEFDAHYSWTE